MRWLFDAIAPRWDAIRSHDRLHVFEAALERIPGEPQRILDLGTGTGDAAIAMARRWPGADVLGVDLSGAMVEEARRKAPELRFEVGDGRRLDVRDDSFDLVALNNVVPFFGELGRVVVPGGNVLIAFSLGPETPIFVAPGRLRRGLAEAGFVDLEEVSAGPGTAVVARRAETH